MPNDDYIRLPGLFRVHRPTGLLVDTDAGCLINPKKLDPLDLEVCKDTLNPLYAREDDLISHKSNAVFIPRSESLTEYVYQTTNVQICRGCFRYCYTSDRILESRHYIASPRCIGADRLEDRCEALACRGTNLRYFVYSDSVDFSSLIVQRLSKTNGKAKPEPRVVKLTIDKFEALVDANYKEPLYRGAFMQKEFIRTRASGYTLHCPTGIVYETKTAKLLNPYFDQLGAVASFDVLPKALFSKIYKASMDNKEARRRNAVIIKRHLALWDEIPSEEVRICPGCFQYCYKEARSLAKHLKDSPKCNRDELNMLGTLCEALICATSRPFVYFVFSDSIKTKGSMELLKPINDVPNQKSHIPTVSRDFIQEGLQIHARRMEYEDDELTPHKPARSRPVKRSKLQEVVVYDSDDEEAETYQISTENCEAEVGDDCQDEPQNLEPDEYVAPERVSTVQSLKMLEDVKLWIRVMEGFPSEELNSSRDTAAVMKALTPDLIRDIIFRMMRSYLTKHSVIDQHSPSYIQEDGQLKVTLEHLELSFGLEYEKDLWYIVITIVTQGHTDSLETGWLMLEKMLAITVTFEVLCANLGKAIHKDKDAWNQDLVWSTIATCLETVEISEKAAANQFENAVKAHGYSNRDI